MPLELKRPLAIFDLEATGVVPETDRIVEIAILRISLDRTRTGYRKLVNPQTPIPPEATEVHGISDRDVRDQKTFPEIANEVAEFMQDCDLAGFNVIAFDLRLLTASSSGQGLSFRSRAGQ
jgi:DNA polymerase-3 subunit epsilon